MTTTLSRIDIVPGASIGPFKLGMKLADALAIAKPKTIARRDDGIFLVYADPDLLVSFDVRHETCTKVEIQGLPKEIPVFAGENRLTTLAEKVVVDWLTSLGPLERFYGSVTIASKGISATKWERDDSEFYCIEVMAPVRKDF